MRLDFAPPRWRSSPSLGLSACTTPYGYSGVSVGVGNGGYGGYGYDGYGYGGYGGYGYPGYGDYGGYGYPSYWGWYDNYYYPGTGYYVYRRDRRPPSLDRRPAPLLGIAPRSRARTGVRFVTTGATTARTFRSSAARCGRTSGRTAANIARARSTGRR